MAAITFPACGEGDDLSGTRRPDGTLEIACATCGHRWDRDGERRCNLCASTDLEYTPKALWERGRGDQRTPAGRIDAYYCHQCGGHDVTSRNPTPGPHGHRPSRRVD